MDKTSSVMTLDLENLQQQGLDLLISYGQVVLLAIIIFFVGRWFASLLKGVVTKHLQRRNIDLAVCQFVGSITYAGVFAVTLVAALSQLGVQTASMVAALGAAGLAIGLALQGSLSNFAAGILLIAFKPCRIGDYIEAGGVSGTVSDISLLATTLLSPDNKKLVVPNAAIMSAPIINYSAMPTRRIDMLIGISYDADIRQARDVIQKILDADTRVLAEPEPLIAVAELADSSVNLHVRPWVNSGDYWPAYFAILENIKLALDENGIGIPYPQLDLHIAANETAQ